MKCPQCSHEWEPQPEARFDFEAIYAEYPRKLGKSRGIARCRSQVKSQKRYDELVAAVRNFAEHHRRRGTSMEYVAHFSTFMGDKYWPDWINPTETPGVGQAQKQQEHSNHFRSQAERIARGEL